MPAQATSNPKRQTGFVKTVLITGLIAGVLDGLAAVISYTIKGGKNPLSVFKFIASGVFGKEAFSGGDIMAVWGLLFHLVIALCFALFLFIIYPRLKFLSANVLLSGFLYGIFVWLVMNRVVLPLSNTPKLSPDITQKIISVLIIIVAVGIPVVFMANRYYKKNVLQSA